MELNLNSCLDETGGTDIDRRNQKASVKSDTVAVKGAVRVALR